MRWATIRRYALVALVVLAAASMFPSFGGGSDRHAPAVQTERARYSETARQPHRVPVPPGIHTWAQR